MIIGVSSWRLKWIAVITSLGIPVLKQISKYQGKVFYLGRSGFHANERYPLSSKEIFK